LNPIAVRWLATRRLLRGSLLALGTVAAAAHAQPVSPNPHRDEPIGTAREVYDGAIDLDMRVNTFRNIERLFAVRGIHHSAQPLPLPRDAQPLMQLTFTSRGVRRTLDDYVRLNAVTGLLVLRDGRIALERYEHGNTERTRWMSMSVAKSVTSTLIGAAVRQGKIASINDPVVRYVPVLRGSAYDGATVRDVLMMSSGVKWVETYTDPTSDRRRLLEAQIAQRPGGAMAVMQALPRAYPPGTHNTYNTGETQVAAEILRGAVGTSLSEYLEERIWRRPGGMEADATWWLDSPGGTEIGGSGIAATLRDYGRIGMMMLNGGVVGGDSILPAGWTREATTPKVLTGGTPLDYGYLWWPAETEQGKRDGAYSADGIFGQFVYVNPAARVVIVVWSAWPKPTAQMPVRDWDVFDAVSAALREGKRRAEPRERVSRLVGAGAAWERARKVAAPPR
jgi:hypothetical protein